MSETIAIQRLRGTEAEKAVATKVPLAGQLIVVTDEQYIGISDATKAIKDIRPAEDRRVAEVDDTTPYTFTDPGPSIAACDTTDGANTVTLPDLASNIGRKIYLINIGAENSIVVNAAGSDGIGAALESAITVTNDVTTTILVATPTYWEQVATGGGGTTTFDVITGLYDTGWIANSDWTDAEFTISHGLGKNLSGLLVQIFLSSDGTEGNALSPYSGQLTAATDADRHYGFSLFQIDTDSFKIQTGTTGVLFIRDSDGQRTILDGATAYYYRVRVYDPNKIAAAAAFEKYSTGWVSLTNWNQATIPVIHGLGENLSDLIVKFFISSDGTEANAIEVNNTEFDYGTAANRESGYITAQVSTNQIQILTGFQGIRYVSRSTSQPILIGSGDTAYYKVVVYKPTFLASELEVIEYDTGWIQESGGDWTDRQFDFTHNLGHATPIARFLLSSDGTDDGLVEVESFGYDNNVPGNASTGVVFRRLSDNQTRVQTGADGVPYLDTSGVKQFLDTETTWYYRFIAYAPKILQQANPAPTKSVATDYEITERSDSRYFNGTGGSSGITITLPDGSGLIPGDEFEIHKVDAGAGIVHFTAQGTDTIDGVAAGTDVDLDSQYDMARIRWTGLYFTLVEYKDHGSNSDGKWERFADGSMLCSFLKSSTDATSTAATPVYSTGNVNFTFPREFYSADIDVTPRCIIDSGHAWPGLSIVPTTTAVSCRYYASLNTTTLYAGYSARGPWRAVA